uniref:Clathrin interactor 1a n=1 Tax=Eptatretus burgeri TaxID=7764 RepID=A0A8C4WVC2_EPTBU
MNMWRVKELVDKATNVVMNYSEMEAKVREATSEEPWGPSGQLMSEIAKATFKFEQFPEVMNMLWSRMLKDNKKSWRRVYKSLLLLSYLVRSGSERVVTSTREHIFDLRSLEHYQFVDEGGKDRGENVRQRVRDLLVIVTDDEALREERKTARRAQYKYIGVAGATSSTPYDDRYGPTPRNQWDEDWVSGGGIGGTVAITEKLGELGDRIGSTIDDTINRFRRRERDTTMESDSDDGEDPATGGKITGINSYQDEDDYAGNAKKKGSRLTGSVTTKTSPTLAGPISTETTTKTPGSARPDMDPNSMCTVGEETGNDEVQNMDLLIDTSDRIPSTTDSFTDFSEFSSRTTPVQTFASSSSAFNNEDFGAWNSFEHVDPDLVPTPAPTMLSGSQSQPLQPKPAQNVPGTWSESNINISLDSLSLGIQASAPAPSMNSLIHGTDVMTLHPVLVPQAFLPSPLITSPTGNFPTIHGMAPSMFGMPTQGVPIRGNIMNQRFLLESMDLSRNDWYVAKIIREHRWNL